MRLPARPRCHHRGIASSVPLLPHVDTGSATHGIERARRAWSARLCHSTQRSSAWRHPSVADPPAVSGTHEGVAVGDGTAGAVRLDTQPLGTDPHPAVHRCGYDDVGDVMCDRVGPSQRPCRFPGPPAHPVLLHPLPRAARHLAAQSPRHRRPRRLAAGRYRLLPARQNSTCRLNADRTDHQARAWALRPAPELRRLRPGQLSPPARRTPARHPSHATRPRPGRHPRGTAHPPRPRYDDRRHPAPPHDAPGPEPAPACPSRDP